MIIAGAVWAIAPHAIPAIFPPLLGDDNEVLVDGNIMNNMPLDLMRDDCEGGTVIGVNPKPTTDKLKPYRFGPSLSGWDALMGRLGWFGARTRAPSILGLAMRATEINSANRMRTLSSRSPTADRATRRRLSLLELGAYRRSSTSVIDRTSRSQLGRRMAVRRRQCALGIEPLEIRRRRKCRIAVTGRWLTSATYRKNTKTRPGLWRAAEARGSSFQPVDARGAGRPDGFRGAPRDSSSSFRRGSDSIFEVAARPSRPRSGARRRRFEALFPPRPTFETSAASPRTSGSNCASTYQHPRIHIISAGWVAGRGLERQFRRIALASTRLSNLRRSGLSRPVHVANRSRRRRPA
jgi:hypothetical protein